ncbi:MAG: aminoglycoside phosphotransferase family protein [Rhodothermales bacterium]
MTFAIPERLVSACSNEARQQQWLERLPETIRDVQERWSISIGSPFDGPDVSCAWVAPVVRRDRSPAVLKIGMPHFEGRDEIDGLRFWNGDPTVRLLESDPNHNAMLLERCIPGTSLRKLPEDEQDEVIARLLRRLWRKPPMGPPFRTLEEMMIVWSDEAERKADFEDGGLLDEALRLLKELAAPSERDVLLATDVHAGNVLRAEREPWLVIDPKPFVGDPAYDTTQHLLNCTARLTSDPFGTIARFSEHAGVDRERLRRWTFARIVLASMSSASASFSMEFIRRLAP